MVTQQAPEPRDRLIVALDVPDRDQALRIVTELQGTATFFKVGYQLFLAEGLPLIRELLERGSRVFLDLKIDDIDETVALAVREIAKAGVDFTTIHGGAATARAAARGRGDSRSPGLLYVTLLSSMDDKELRSIGVIGSHPGAGFPSLAEYIRWRATKALEAGCDGLIASGDSVAELRQVLGDGPTIVTPGIRPDPAATNEHRRAQTPRQAISAGADYIVVGRPIRDASDRAAAARAIIDEIEDALASAARRPV